MFKAKWQGILASLLTIFLMAGQPLYGRTLSEANSINPMLEEKIYDEGIVKINIPLELIRNQFIAQLVQSESNKEAYIKEIHRFDMDPMQDLLMISGVALLPADVVMDMNDIAGGGDFAMEHQFQISVKFPSARKLALTRYFSLEFVEFKIDGQNYLNAINRIGQYVVGMLSNTSFMDWILNTEESTPSQVGESLSETIANLIRTKGLRFRDRTISFKIDSSKIEALRPYQSLTDIRLWNITPVLLGGTGQVALQIEAGLGKPGDRWFDAVKERGESEEQTLAEARQALYETFGNVAGLNAELAEYAKTVKEQLLFPLWEERQERSYTSLISHLESRVREGLSPKNPLFMADPEETNSALKNELKAKIVDELTELKLRASTLYALKQSGSLNQKMPFISKRLSQRALSQGMRFARDFDFEGEQLFPELEVVLAPHIPGVILRGVMNMDLNVFMEMGLEGEGIQWSATPWRLAEDVWGKGLPFEVALRVHAFDGGVLGLDVVNFSILSGSEKTSLSKTSGHGHLISTWTKMAIVESLTTLAIEDPMAVQPKPEQGEVVAVDEPYKHTLDKINEQKSVYQKELSRMLDGDLAALVKLAEIDIEKNPFNMAGSEQVAQDLKYLFEDIIKYDEKSEMIQFKLDPKIVSQTLLSSENTIQVWNIESLYDKIFNQTFVEFAVGDGVRSQKYVQSIFNCPENKDSQEFVGVDETRDQVPSDLIFKTDLKNFENFLNRLFVEAANEQMKGVQGELKKNVEQSHTVIRDLSLSAPAVGQLQLNVTASLYEKSKKGFFGRIFSNDSWKVTHKDVLVKARLKLSVENLNKYLRRVKLAPNEVFFGEEVLRLDLAEAGIKFTGDTSTLDKMVNLVAGNLNFEGGISQKVKRIVLNFLHSYLNDRDPKKNGNTTLGGVRLNKYAKVLAHDDEILIQLNPHLMGVAFDVRLIDNQDFSGKKLGLLVDPVKNELEFHFSTSGNLANVDKGELLRIMVKGKEIFEPFLKSDDSAYQDQKMLIELFDRVIYNSDYTKLSLYHRLKRVLKNYQGVLDVVKPDTSVVDQINRNLGTQFGVTSGVANSRLLTGSGVEIMYFVSTASILTKQMKAFVEKAKSMGVSNQVTFIGPMEGKINEIRTRMIDPLVELYEKSYQKRNQKIVAKGVTDWNHTYYPDALYCEGVYKFLKKWREKDGR